MNPSESEEDDADALESAAGRALAAGLQHTVQNIIGDWVGLVGPAGGPPLNQLIDVVHKYYVARFDLRHNVFNYRVYVLLCKLAVISPALVLPVLRVNAPHNYRVIALRCSIRGYSAADGAHKTDLRIGNDLLDGVVGARKLASVSRVVGA